MKPLMQMYLKYTFKGIRETLTISVIFFVFMRDCVHTYSSLIITPICSLVLMLRDVFMCSQIRWPSQLCRGRAVSGQGTHTNTQTHTHDRYSVWLVVVYSLFPGNACICFHSPAVWYWSVCCPLDGRSCISQWNLSWWEHEVSCALLVS